jgi:hypothetical protein
MKIVVAATRHAHALSRRQVEALFAALPSGLADGVDTFLLASWLRGSEPFEYIASQRRIESAMPVVDKTPATTEAAVREFLLGLARMHGGSTFWKPLNRSERCGYDEFVATHLPRCRVAVGLSSE